MKKKLLSLSLALIMLLSFGAFAEETTPTVSDTAKVVLDVSEPDKDGYFTAKLTVFDAEFFGLQGAINFDSKAVVPVSADKKETTEFSEFAKMPLVAKELETDKEIPNWISTIGNKIDMEKGLFTFSLYLAAGQTDKNSIVNDKMQIVADDKGLTFYEFNFKKISDKDANFKIGSEPANPNGIILADIGANLPYSFVINMPKSISKVETPVYTYKYTAPIIVSDEKETVGITTKQKVKYRAQNVIFLNIGNYAAVSNGLLKWVDMENKNVMPYIKDSRTMVPLRFLSEQLGATITYNEETKAITIVLNDKNLVLTVGEKAYTINGVSSEMDAIAEVIEGRTFVPVRFVSEALGKSVEWLENEKMVIVTPTNYPWAKDNKIEKELLSEINLLVSPLIRDIIQ